MKRRDFLLGAGMTCGGLVVTQASRFVIGRRGNGKKYRVAPMADQGYSPGTLAFMQNCQFDSLEKAVRAFGNQGIRYRIVEI